jgi:putative endonuclease
MNQTDPIDLEIFSIAHAAQQRAIKNRRRRLRSKQLALRPKAAKSLRSARQTTGDAFEALASQYLEKQGLTVLARQLTCPLGEVDLVLRHGNTLVFAEVRARTHASHGGAAASITAHKQRRLIRAAKWHLSALANRFFAGSTPACRIDVITFDHGHLLWLQDAIRLEQDK